MQIDGVFSGGGIKGFALIGAYAAVEKKGFHFKRVAGTSAGSIIAGFISAGYSSEEVFRIVDQLELESLLDQRKTIIPSPLTKWILLYWKLGLYKGDAFEEWVAAQLAAKGVYTFGDLPEQSLRVVASDLTNSRLIVLPDDLPLYNIRPETFSVAKAIRMSCSLPYFFEPVKIKDGKNTSIIVDGGVLSNFPMWLFDNNRLKKVRPVLGIKLSPSSEERPKNKISNGITLFSALFETMKDAHDARYISRKHEKNIIFIPATEVLTTQFDLTEKMRKKLFQLGYEKAEQFLQTWTY